MQEENQQADPKPATRRISQWKLLLASTIYFIIQAIVVLVLFWFMVKSWKENFQIEKSVMKPEMIDSFEVIASGIVKMYDLDDSSASNAKNLKSFEHNIRKYGIELNTQDFEFEGRKGTNVYAEMNSRKESRFRHYLLAFNKNNPLEIAAVHIYLTEFFNRNTNMGLSLIILGYDGIFKNYNIAVRQFLTAMFSEQKIIKSCNFIRDGLSIEIALSSAANSAVFYYPCKLTRRQGRDDVRL